MSCGNISKSSISSPNENLLVVCPRIEGKAPATFGDTMQQLNDLTDMYTDCRIRHNGLVDYERKRK